MKAKHLSISLITLILLSFSKLLVAQANDRDTVHIGKQIWMKVNLSLANFRNGDPIPEAQSAKDWQKASDEDKPAWCHCRGCSSGGKQGKLYNWYAVHDKRGLAPQGWHIPSEAEWDTLVSFLGGENTAGAKMRNNPGFSAIDATSRAGYGNFYDDDYGRFWSSTENENHEAWNIYLLFKDLTTIRFGETYSKVYHSYADKACGYSVRCVKD